MLKKLLQGARSHYPLSVAALVAVLLLLGVIALMEKASRESDARKSPEALQFEKAPDDWLTHQKSVAEFRNALNAGNLSAVGLDGAEPGLVLYTLKSGEKGSTLVPGCTMLGCAGTALDSLGDKSARGGFALVRVEVDPRTASRRLLDMLTALLSPVLLVAALVGAGIVSIRLQRGMGGAASRLAIRPKTQFTDAIGQEEAKAALNRVKAFMQDPVHYAKLGAVAPRGVLLVGPPGTGKTLLARAIAGEANVPFFTISGSDFVEMFVGVGASRVRDMFEQGKKNAPCIIFIDEIDAVGRHRGAGLGGGNDEREQTLNQMLVEMDGFESNEGVILIAATNRPDVLDPALLRPGRFDRQVVVPNPDVNGREKILRVHMRKVPLASDVDPKVIARGTPGFSGADLANLVNEAALLAARMGKRVVAMHEFESAKDKVLMGTERRSLVMSEAEKRMTAYHEAGHALCAMHEPECDPVHKATIIPRGRALGLVMSLPEGDRYSKSKSKLLGELTMAMGGRAAEEIIFGPDKVSNGASGDIKMATDQARRMITEWGMSEKLGMIAYGDNSQEVFLGHSVTQSKNVSEATAQEIDGEIRGVIDRAYAKAKRLLTENIEELHRVARGLLEHETLSGDEIRTVLRGEPVIRKVVDEPAPESRRASVPNAGRPASQPTPPAGGLGAAPQPG
jgi:cell division protease FtsH